MIPSIEQEFARTEALMTDEAQRLQFLDAYLDLMRTVNGLHTSFAHHDPAAPPIARITKDYDLENLTAEQTLNIVTEVFNTATKINEKCLQVQQYASIVNK